MTKNLFHSIYTLFPHSSIGVNLRNANLEGSQMAKVNLRVATLKHGNMKNCDLRGAVLAGADLEVL